MIYIAGKRILDESDKQPQWNLMPNTGQKYKNILIPKNNNFSGEYIFGTFGNTSPLIHVSTFSAYIKNNTNVDIEVYEFDNANVTIAGPIIKAQSERKIQWTVNNLSALFYSTVGRATVAEDISFQVKEEKLELGDIATPWMPAISDLALKSDLGG